MPAMSAFTTHQQAEFDSKYGIQLYHGIGVKPHNSFTKKEQAILEKYYGTPDEICASSAEESLLDGFVTVPVFSSRIGEIVGDDLPELTTIRDYHAVGNNLRKNGFLTNVSNNVSVTLEMFKGIAVLDPKGRITNMLEMRHSTTKSLGESKSV